jgi:hypothetical protein
MIDYQAARLAGHAAEQGGVFTTAQALDAGMHKREIARLVSRGDWVRLRRGAFVLRETFEAADDVGRHLLHVHAASLTLASAHRFSHISSALLHELPCYRLDLEEVHVTHVEGTSSGRHESGIWHHVGDCPPDQLVTCRGLPALSPARTAFDVARVASPQSALVVADAALGAGATREQLRAQLERCGDWPGARRASRVLPMADGRAESPGESVARWALHAIGMPPDELQLRLSTDGGPVRTDFAWRKWRLVGEFDGKVKYGRLVRPGESAADVAWRERQRELAVERADWGVVRFTWADAHELDRMRYLMLQARERSDGRRSA